MAESPLKKSLGSSKSGFLDGVWVEGDLSKARLKVEILEDSELIYGIENILWVGLGEGISISLSIKAVVINENEFYIRTGFRNKKSRGILQFRTALYDLQFRAGINLTVRDLGVREGKMQGG